jgi:hypothetical protein
MPIYCNPATQEYYSVSKSIDSKPNQWCGKHTRYDDVGNPISDYPHLREAAPLTNYAEVDWKKKYLDIDLEMYFAQGQLEAIKEVLFPRKHKY